MITEDYVSFETAKLLKEKGFDEYGMYFYTLEDEGREGYKSNKRIQEFAHNSHPELEKRAVSCPTLQMAMKWLREVHNQTIVPGIRVDDQTSGIINCYIVGIWYIPKNNGGAFCYTSPTPYNGYPSYEEACEAAIKYCLENLI